MCLKLLRGWGAGGKRWVFDDLGDGGASGVKGLCAIPLSASPPPGVPWQSLSSSWQRVVVWPSSGLLPPLPVVRL